MRLVFAGTPQFAERALARLLSAGHHIALVLTQPDRPAGRGQRSAPSAVKRLASDAGLGIFQPDSLHADAAARVRAARPDALVVVAYGLLLPPALLELAPHGALNIHASLLPRWRGAAPIQRALLAGDAETGVSIMQMDAGLDTGPVFAQRRIALTADEDAGSLHDRLAALGADMIVSCLADIENGRGKATPQPAHGASYARKVDKRETALDWLLPAVALERAVRAFRPAPGAWTRLQADVLKVWRARVVEATGAPGEVLEAGRELVVACGADALAIAELQRPGGRRLDAQQFLRGFPVPPGTRFA